MRLIDADELSKWISGQSKSPSCPKNESAFGLRIMKHIDRMPSAQPERTEKHTETHSCDCISRHEAIDIANDLRACISVDGYWAWMERLKKLPSAQSEIVRCKDCRWRKDQSGSTAWLPCRVLVTPDDFYCGRAERRTDG